MKFKKNNLNTTIILLFYFINIQNSTINLPDTFPENGCISFPVELDGFGTVQATMRIDYDSPYFSDSEQSSYNNVSTSSNEIDWREQHSKDWHSHHQQETTNNYNSQTYTQENNIHTTQRELFDKALDKTNNSYDLANKFSSSIAEQYLKQLRKDTADKFARKHRRFLDRKKTFPLEQAELKFLDLLISKEITELLKQISHPDLSVAQAAFAKLKKLWPWKRNHTFLTASFVNGTGETGFNVRLGIDTMAIAERDLISRSDYVTQYADAEHFKTIQEFREKCIALQQKGDKRALSQEELALRHKLHENGKNDDFTTNVCYAIAKKASSDITTSILNKIIHDKSLETAYSYINYLEQHIVEQMQQQNINPAKQTKEFMLRQYGFNLLEAAYNGYYSRSDYTGTIKNQAILSHPFLSTILHNIEYKNNLPEAHIELTHLVKQIMKDFEQLNITDPVAQKELLLEDFDVDIIELVNKMYKERHDHQAVTKLFLPIDVHNNSINILNTSHDYASVSQGFDIMAKQVFHNARLCKLDFVENIENHVIDSIHIIKAPQNDAQFVFNVTVVDHLLTDIQQKVDDIVEGKSTSYTHYIERGSELFTRAIVKFVTACNPITQVKSIYEVFKSAGHHLKNAVYATAYEIYDPITVTQNNLIFYARTCESLINSARFTADLTFGKFYLSPEEYQQRCDIFWKTFEPITTESFIDFAAQIAADFVYGKGLSIVFIYLKEIDAAAKLENYAAKIADKLKQAIDTHLADNPILVTAEGIALQMSNDLKNIGETAKEIITDSNTLVKKVTTDAIDTSLIDLKAIGNNTWKSPGGLIYKPDKKFGNRIQHVLAHAEPNSMKNLHTVFNVPKDKILQLIDEAWVMKGAPLISDSAVYIVDMKKSIGLNGESAIKIVVIPGTSEIITAYPISL